MRIAQSAIPSGGACVSKRCPSLCGSSFFLLCLRLRVSQCCVKVHLVSPKASTSFSRLFCGVPRAHQAPGRRAPTVGIVVGCATHAYTTAPLSCFSPLPFRLGFGLGFHAGGWHSLVRKPRATENRSSCCRTAPTIGGLYARMLSPSELLVEAVTAMLVTAVSPFLRDTRMSTGLSSSS